MDEVLQALLSWQFLFLCLAIGAIVFAIRQVVEYAMENWWPLKDWTAAHKDSKLWRDLILPLLPIKIGLLIVLIAKQYPYPEGFTSNSSKIIFGLVAGFSSGFIVKLYRAFLASKVSDFANKIAPKKHEEEDHKELEEKVRNSINKE